MAKPGTFALDEFEDAAPPRVMSLEQFAGRPANDGPRFPGGRDLPGVGDYEITVPGDVPPAAAHAAFDPPIMTEWPHTPYDHGGIDYPRDTGILAGIKDRAVDLFKGGVTTADFLARGLTKMEADIAASRGRTTAPVPSHGFGLAPGSSLGAFLKPPQTPTIPDPQPTYFLAELENVKKEIAYKPKITWAEVKQSTNPLDWGRFILQEGLISTPDMAAVLLSTPTYIFARTGSLAEDRAKNQGRNVVTGDDVMWALPTAIAAGAMERTGTRGIFFGTGQTAGSRIAKAGTKEAATEAGQEATEYAGTTLDTKKKFDVAELIDRMAAGAVVGGPFGASVRTGMEGVGAGLNRLPPSSSPLPLGDPRGPALDALSPYSPNALDVRTGESVVGRLPDGTEIVARPPNNPRDVANFPTPQRALRVSPDEFESLEPQREAMLPDAEIIRNPDAPRLDLGFERDRPGFTRDRLSTDGWRAEREPDTGVTRYAPGATQRWIVTAPDGRVFHVPVTDSVNPKEAAVMAAQARAEGREPPSIAGEGLSFPPWLPEAKRARLTSEHEGRKAAERASTPTGAPLRTPTGRAIPTIGPISRPASLGIPTEIFRGSGRSDRAAAYSGTAFPIMGRGRYSAFDRKTASRFGPNVEAAQIETQNPLVIRSDDEWRALTHAAGWVTPNPTGRSEAEMAQLTARLNQEIRKRGHDSVAVYWDDTADGDFDGDRPIKTLRKVFGNPQFFVPETDAPPRTETGRPIPPPEARTTPARTSVGQLMPARAAAFTPAGRKIEVQHEVVELNSLIPSHTDDLRQNPKFPLELQPRERDRAASAAQISEIAAKLEPERLGPSSDVTGGAPVVGPDNTVESGNARTLALRKVFRDYSRALKAGEDTKNHLGKRYLDFLVSQGFNVEGMKHPVLIARRRTPLSPADRVAFTKEANEASALRMGAAEQAKSDAGIVKPIIEQFKGGDVSFAQNAGFVRSFLNALSATERGSLWTDKGGLSQEGVRRIQAAMLFAAYEDADLVAKLMESPSNDIKSIGGALLDVSAAWAKMRALVEAGEISPDIERTKDLMGAVAVVTEARNKGMLVSDVLDQGSLFDDKDTKRDFVGMFFNDPAFKQPASRAAIATRLRAYIEEAKKALAGPNLFGDKPASAKEILKATKGKGEGVAEPGGSVTLRSGFDPTKPFEWYSRQATRVLDLIHGKVGYRLAPLGNLPMEPEYLAERYRTVGKLANIDKIGHKIFRAFRRADKADRKAVYDYMTTRGATPVGIKNPKVRSDAIEAKALIEEVGRKLVDHGLLNPDVFEAHRGEYLPRVYLTHLLKKKMSGARVGLNLGYLKERKDIPEEIRKLILGEITDPAYLTARGYMMPMRDLVFADFLGFISQSNEWTLKNSLVEWRGETLSAAWLWHEAQRLRTLAEHSESDRVEIIKVAVKMEAVAKPGLAIEKVEGFTQVPDTPKFGKLRGMWIRTEIWNDLFSNMGFWIEEPSLAEKVLGPNGLLSRLTQYWKLGKVALNPGTIVRNTFGNLSLLQLSGVPVIRIPDRLAQSLIEMATNGRHWQIAKQYGVTSTNFAHSEMIRLDRLARSVQAMSGDPNGRLIALIGGIADAAGRFYGSIEALFKVAKIIDAIEREGMSPEKAALEAHKWIFDYSLVTKSTRYLRNLGVVGIPFLTFATKVFPRLVEIAATKPWRVWPYVAMAYALPAIAISMLGWDEDDYEAAKKTLPKFLREKQHGFFLPWRDEHGRLQWVDMSAWAVWNVFSETGEKLAKGDIGGAAYTFGLGGPTGNLLVAGMGKTDPFTGRRITNPYDPPEKQFLDWWTYIGRVMLPPWLTDQGAAAKLQETLNEKVDRRTGEPKLTTTQAGARFFGLNITPVDPKKARETNIAVMRRELRELQARFRYTMFDKNLKDEDRARLRESWNARIREKAQELQNYSTETERVTRFK